MTYQTKLIIQCIQSRLRRAGIASVEDKLLETMIATKIRRLRMGEQIAINLDESGEVKDVQRIEGVDCLHTVDERAIVISYRELERYFYEQQSATVEL
jgi:hypothetical protein